MADGTKIEWTDASWNPIRARNRKTGAVGHYCEKISPGCAQCFASAMQPRFHMPEFLGRVERVHFGDNKGVEVFLDEKILDQPLRWKKPRMIFPCSMTDLFGAWVPDEWIDKILTVMALCPQHVFQVLTKRAERMASFISHCRFNKLDAAARSMGYTLEFAGIPLVPWPLKNIWAGVSVENQDQTKRISWLRKTPAAILWLSLEPLLGPLELDLSGISWLVIGGESGRTARPCQLEWIRSIIKQCREAGVPCFVKQLGRHVHLTSPGGQLTSWWPNHPKGGDMAEWPEDVRVRQMPGAAIDPALIEETLHRR